jgi:hypothetical protein
MCQSATSAPGNSSSGRPSLNRWVLRRRHNTSETVSNVFYHRYWGHDAAGYSRLNVGLEVREFPMAEVELEASIARIRARYAEIRKSSSPMESFLLHLHSLGQWEQEPMDFPTVTAKFPAVVHVAYAVCHPDCGREEVIIDGSTQECQRCGRLMFRTVVQKYERK